MNLWQRIEKRGREELNLNEYWHLYAVDLDSSKHGYADVKFAQKERNRFKVMNSILGLVKYHDLR